MMFDLNPATLNNEALRPVLTPDPLETALSFTNRLAAFHVGLRTTEFLRDVGIAPMSLVAGEPEALDRLCQVSGCDRGRLLRNTPVRSGKRIYVLRDHTLPAEFFSRPTTVYCPACLQEDDTRASAPSLARQFRWIWALEVVRTCPQHEISLIRLAKKKHDDELNELAVRAPVSRDDLEEEVASANPRSVSPLQSYVVERLEGHQGRDFLDQQSLDAVVRAAELLGAVLVFGAAVNLATLTDDQRDKAGAQGFRLLEQGEVAVRGALQRMLDAADGTSSSIGPQKVFGRLYTSMSGKRSNEDYGALRGILRDFILDSFALAAGAKVLGRVLEVRRLHTVTSLANETGLDVRTLRHLLVAKGLVPEGAAPHFAFDVEKGRAVAKQVVRKVTVIALPKALGCSRPTSDQILEERLLTPLADGTAYATGRTRKAVFMDEVTDLLNRLAAASRLVEEVGAGMSSISKAAEKAKRPAGYVLHLILGGYLKNVVRVGTDEGINSLRVNPEEVKSAMESIAIGMSVGEACQQLRIPVQSGWALVECDELPSDRIRAPNKQHSVTRCQPADVAELGKRLINAGRIGQALDIPAFEIEQRLRHHRVSPAYAWKDIGVNLFHRADVERLFSI